MRHAFTIVTLLASFGCQQQPPPDGSYYRERIEPAFLNAGCASITASCHLADDRGAAAGNLDMTSYDSLMRRRDALPAYGPYPIGLLLLKASTNVDVAVETLDPPDPANPDARYVNIRTDIRHTGGQNLIEGSPDHVRILEWINSGFQRNGVPVDTSIANTGDCVTELGSDTAFDPEAAPADEESYRAFVSDVQPVLREQCAGSGCHGAALADLHLTCGDTEAQLRWNYWISVQHLSDPATQSELLRRPLATNRGGTFHGGGDTWQTEEHSGYVTVSRWAQDLVDRAPSLVREDTADPGYRFFVNRVQPVLVRKGCMALNCHSPISLKLNLRGGSQGSFSSFARHRNYKLTRKLLALEAPDPSESRLVAKNLFTPDLVDGGMGIAHRGAALFEDLSTDGVRNPISVDDCVGVDADNGDLNAIPAYCVVARWHQIERQEAIARGEIFADSEIVRAVVWVDRPLEVGDITDFDTFRPGADLVSADVTVAADGSMTLGVPVSLLGGCGLPAGPDVRNPAVSWDGQRIAFAARTAASEPLRLYWMNEDGSGCERVPGVAPAVDRENGILTHDFDPAWAPDGRVVFASTRGNLDRAAYDWAGPTRTPAAMAPNANLYVQDADGSVRQLTFLLNQELAPAFMSDGRVIFTAEKRAEGFHHLALRRENLDGGDFHPLYASRDSLGFGAAAEVAQLPNLNFAFTATEIGLPDGAGMIAIGNRSIGPDHQDRSLDQPGFVRGMTIPAPGVLGGLPGVFRSPAALPTGRVLAACEPTITAMGPGFDWDLCEIDYRRGNVRRIGGSVGRADTEPVAVYGRTRFPILVSDGGGIDRPNIVAGARDAEVHFNDFPMIASLMFSNTRVGRPLDQRIGGFDVLETLPPPVGATTFADVSGEVVTDEIGPMFVSERRLGNVPLFADGSTRMRLPGGTSIRYLLTDDSGNALDFPAGGAFEGAMLQREHEQYYPGERIQRSIPRRFFNSVCGGCHGSISGRELDIAVDIDVVSGASINEARDADPVDLMR